MQSRNSRFTHTDLHSKKRERSDYLRPLLAALSLAGLVGVSRPVPAAQKQHEGKVAVGGTWILTIRASAGGMSIRERADAVQSRLVTILSDPNIRPADIVAVPLGDNEAKVMVNDKLLVTATSDTARLYDMSPIGLARHWARHLRTVLPKINAKPNPIMRKHASVKR